MIPAPHSLTARTGYPRGLANCPWFRLCFGGDTESIAVAGICTAALPCPVRKVGVRSPASNHEQTAADIGSSERVSRETCQALPSRYDAFSCCPGNLGPRRGPTQSSTLWWGSSSAGRTATSSDRGQLPSAPLRQEIPTKGYRGRVGLTAVSFVPSTWASATAFRRSPFCSTLPIASQRWAISSTASLTVSAHCAPGLTSVAAYQPGGQVPPRWADALVLDERTGQPRGRPLAGRRNCLFYRQEPAALHLDRLVEGGP